MLVPPIMLIAFVTVFGVGMILSAMNVKYRDIRHIVPFLVHMWMYCSVLIPFSKVREKLGDTWCWLYGLNPMAGVVEGMRWCLMHPKMTLPKVTETVLENRVVPETLERGQEVVVRVLADQGTTETILRQTTLFPVDPPWALLCCGLPTALLLLLFGLWYFKRMEKTFADIV